MDKLKGRWPIPGSVEEALKWWDNETPLMTVSMGGIGPGYEQCIHIAVFEILRAHLKGVPLPEMEKELGRIDERTGLQLSNGQAGAAMALAAEYIKGDWGAVVNNYKNNRQIMVSKFWPSAEMSQKMEEARPPNPMGFGERKIIG